MSSQQYNLDYGEKLPYFNLPNSAAGGCNAHNNNSHKIIVSNYMKNSLGKMKFHAENTIFDSKADAGNVLP